MAVEGWVTAELYITDCTLDEATEIMAQCAAYSDEYVLKVRQTGTARRSQLAPDTGLMVNRTTIRIEMQSFPWHTSAWVRQILEWDEGGRQGPIPV